MLSSTLDELLSVSQHSQSVAFFSVGLFRFHYEHFRNNFAPHGKAEFWLWSYLPSSYQNTQIQSAKARQHGVAAPFSVAGLILSNSVLGSPLETPASNRRKLAHISLRSFSVLNSNEFFALL